MTSETQVRWALILMASIMGFAALWVAQPVFAPLTLAFVVAIVLSPLSDFWQRLGVPQTLASFLTFALSMAALLVAILSLEPLAVSLYEQIPRIRWELRDTISGIQSMLQGLNKVSDEVSKAIAPDAAANDATQAGDNAAISIPPISDALFLAPAIAGQVMIFAGGLYFLLLCRNDVYRWLARVSPGDTAAAVRGFRTADRTVARYSLTITLINTALGIAVAAALHLVGLPGAIVWGFVAALMNFIVYLGPAIVALSLVVAGTVAFDGAYAFAPAITFVSLNAIEGQFITPTLVGRHLRVNPLLVFLSLCFWLWLWGPIGGIVAIPVLVWAIAVTDALGLAQTISSGTAGTARPQRHAADIS